MVACRRVKAAICAFGGNVVSSIPPRSDRDSIFRGVNRWNQQYETRLHKRYHVNGGHLSWEMEENPPIHVEPEKGIKGRGDDQLHLSPEGSSMREGKTVATPSPTPSDNEQPKMKYRCKLCGQPKQAHVCPYRQSMQRSIGVSVYPAVNAYTASEPGDLAPALADMNNFVDRSFEDAAREVSPDGSKSLHSSEASTLSPHSTTLPSEVTPPGAAEGRKRKHSETTPRPFSPYVAQAPLCREQYRAITVTPTESDFSYPPVPISFSERKRLSDTLFALSREIHHLTEEVSSILHQAREREMWDQAVAEIMTQVVVALYCGEGDKQLDGLQHYLLGIGVSC